MKIGSNGAATPNLSKNTGYIKNKTRGRESILVTIINLWLKCYLKFYKIVADKMRSKYILARAITKYKLILRKKYKNYKSNFSTFTDETSFVSSSSVKIHLTLSPLDSPSLSTISCVEENCGAYKYSVFFSNDFTF